MPLVFEGRCSACGATSPRVTDGYLAVALDEPAPVDLAHPEEPNLAVLAHPGEHSILKRIGYTLDSAARHGRLIRFTTAVCLTCGRFFETRRLAAGLICLPPWGCLLGLAAVVWSGLEVGLAVALNIGTGWGVFAGCMTGWSSLAALDVAIRVIVRRRHWKRAFQQDVACRCPGCYGANRIPPRSGLKGLPCPACGQHTVAVKWVGES